MFFFVKTELLETPHTTVEINELMIVTTDEQGIFAIYRIVPVQTSPNAQQTQALRLLQVFVLNQGNDHTQT